MADDPSRSLTYEAAPEFQPFELRWDHPQLTEGLTLMTLAVSSGGTSTCRPVMVSPWSSSSADENPVFATRRASVYIEYKDSNHDLQRVRNYAADQFSWKASGEGSAIRIGSHSLRASGTDPSSWRYELELHLPEAQVALTFVPLHRGFLPSEDGSYFRHARDPRLQTSVSFSAPLMRGEGTVTVRGRTREVNGRGYHDHPWGTRQLFFTHGEWHWGRMSDETLGAMFADVTPQSRLPRIPAIPLSG